MYVRANAEAAAGAAAVNSPPRAAPASCRSHRSRHCDLMVDVSPADCRRQRYGRRQWSSRTVVSST